MKNYELIILTNFMTLRYVDHCLIVQLQTYSVHYKGNCKLLRESCESIVMIQKGTR